MSFPSLSDDSLEQDKKRRCLKWGDLKVSELEEELRKRELKRGGRKSELVKRLEEYEASESEARGNSSNSEFDEFGDDDDEMAGLDFDNIITTHNNQFQ